MALMLVIPQDIPAVPLINALALGHSFLGALAILGIEQRTILLRPSL